MNTFIKVTLSSLLLVIAVGKASAGVYDSQQVLAVQQHNFNKEQVLSFVDSSAVQQKLSALGVSPADAKLRIASMTQDELSAFNSHINDMPAGGIVGTIVTVLVVVAILDLMGITDVYPFINPV